MHDERRLVVGRHQSIFRRYTMQPHKKILVSGLGGGLDVLNASLVYFAALEDGQDAHLGSVRPTAISRISNHKPFAGF